MKIFNTYYLPTKREAQVAITAVAAIGAESLAVATVQTVALSALLTLTIALAVKIADNFCETESDLREFIVSFINSLFFLLII